MSPMPSPSRPTLRGTFGIVASTHWLASSVGMAVLERGGNAFDAAVAAGLTLQVVEPHMNGPGGDLPVVFWSAERGEPLVLCAQGPAPAAASVAEFRRRDEPLIPGVGLLAACVPGAFDGWMRLLRDFGTWRLADVAAYAIGYAVRRVPGRRPGRRDDPGERVAAAAMAGLGGDLSPVRGAGGAPAQPPAGGDVPARRRRGVGRRVPGGRDRAGAGRRGTGGSSPRRSTPTAARMTVSCGATISPRGSRRSNRRSPTHSAG